MKLHTSKYVMYAELPGYKDYLIVHGYTGAIDLVRQRVASFLKRGGMLENDSNADAIPQNTIAVLKRRGYLTGLDPRDEREHIIKLAELIHRVACRRSSFIFFVTYDCNFNCTYCFQRRPFRSAQRLPVKTMTKEMVDKAFRAMSELNPVRQLCDNRIVLLGGEPLLEENYDIVSYIVEKGVASGYVFGAITNGYSVDRYIRIIKPGLIQSLQVTLDGPPDRHNIFRRHQNGCGTFDRIARNIDCALAAGVSVNVRINVNGDDKDGLGELNHEFTKRGWANTGLFAAYVARTRCRIAPDDVSDRTAGSVMKEDADMFQGQDICATQIQREAEADKRAVKPSPDLVGFRPEKAASACGPGRESPVANEGERNCIWGFDPDLRGRIRRILRLATGIPFRGDFCGATNGMSVFEPNGNIYACLETVGLDKFRIGTYGDSIQIDRERIESWWERSLNSTGCSECKYLLVCGRGCPVGSMPQGRRGGTEVCREFPALFKQALIEEFTNTVKNGNEFDRSLHDSQLGTQHNNENQQRRNS